MFDSRNERLVAETVFRNPDKTYYVRGLADEVGLAPSTVSRMVNKLEKKGLIKVKDNNIKKEIATVEDQKFRDFKRSYNIFKLYNTGLVEDLYQETVPEAIILFGSYSRGEDTDNSDVDIAIVNGREKEKDFEEYEKELSRRLSIHNVRLEEADQNFIETLANGVVLRGYLEI